MVRNAMFHRVELAARDDLEALVALEEAAAQRTDPPLEVTMTRAAWDEALEEYFTDHDRIGTGPDAHGPDLFQLTVAGRRWQLRQTLDDPAGDRDWVIEAELDLDASDEVGEPVLVTTAMRRL
jgi:hypothetical protein